MTLTADVLSKYDAVLVLTDHSKIDYQWVVAQAQLVIDTRNANQQVTEHREEITKA